VPCRQLHVRDLDNTHAWLESGAGACPVDFTQAH
jgi:hypothetical protein